MTLELTGERVAVRLSEVAPGIRTTAAGSSFYVGSTDVALVCSTLRDDPELRMQLLISLTAVDYVTHFEMVYHLQSLAKNHLAVLKVRIEDREQPEVPTVSTVWQGAHLQEREVYDLFGIRFPGHSDLRRIFLWEGFAGYPLRKDFLQIANGAQHPGLPHFPKQEQGYGVLVGPNWTGAPAEEPPAP